MELKVFKTFIEVARERHFGRAAENLYLTQAAVSARIKQLEGYFDTRLFIRDRNNIKLTSSGERLVPYAEVLVATVEQAKAELALAENKVLQVALAGSPNIWDAYLQRCLNVLSQECEGYAFQVEVLGREQLHRRLLERTLDVAFCVNPFKSDELLCQQVASLDLRMVSTRAQLHAEQALAYRYVFVDWGTRFVSEHNQRHSGAPAPFMRTSTGRIALKLMLEHGGSAYLPKSLVDKHLESGALHLVEGVEPSSRPVYVNYRRDSASLEAIEKIIQFAVSIK